MNNSNLKIYASVIVVAVFLFFSGLWGFQAGKKAAESKLTLKNVEQLHKALEYFYSDNDRLPTAVEARDPAIMKPFLTSLHFYENIPTGCQYGIAYERLQKNSGQLSFCLSKSVSGYKQGVTRIEINL